MTNKIKLVAFITLLLTANFFAQTKDDKNKISDELKKSTIELIHETSQDVLKMQSRSNRIIYATQVAGLIWEYNEKEAKSLYQMAMNEIRQSLVQLETDATLPENAGLEMFSVAAVNAVTESGSASNTNAYNASVAAANTVVKSASALNTNAYAEQPFEIKSVRNLDYQLLEKFDVILRFRQKLLLSLAENDPSMADDFLRETTQIIISEQFKEKIVRQDKLLERKIALVVGKTQPDKTLEAGRKFIAENRFKVMTSFIENFYKFDADKAITLAGEFAKKLETADLTRFNSIIELLTANENTKNNKDKKPLLTESNVKALIDAAAKQLLAANKRPGLYIVFSLLPKIEKHSPLLAKQIIQKFSNDKESGEEFKAYQSGQNIASTGSGETQVSKEELEKERVSNKIGKEKLTDDERKQIIEEFRATLSVIKVAERAIITLRRAQDFSNLGENEIAQSLLEEEKVYPPTQVETAKDAILSWDFASFYSSTEPKKAFDLLETATPPLNDILDSFIKVSHFIETENDEILENGEIKMHEPGPIGDFAKTMLRNLQRKEETLKNLAKSDFLRTKNLANKFNRPEIQIELKILIIKSVFGKTDEDPNSDVMYNEDYIDNAETY
jgi:hypothetical protein